MTTTDLSWLAGLLEGEGCFCGTSKYPEIELAMTDKDVVERAAALLGASVRRKHPPAWQRRGWSEQWRVRVFGDKARDLMRSVRPLMGQRRGEKIDSLLT